MLSLESLSGFEWRPYSMDTICEIRTNSGGEHRPCIRLVYPIAVRGSPRPKTGSTRETNFRFRFQFIELGAIACAFGALGIPFEALEFALAFRSLFRVQFGALAGMMP